MKAWVVYIIKEGMDYSEEGYYRGSQYRITPNLSGAKIYTTYNLANNCQPMYDKKKYPDIYRNMHVEIRTVNIEEVPQ